MPITYSIFKLPDRATIMFTEPLKQCDFPFSRVAGRVKDFPVRWSLPGFPYSGLYDGVMITLNTDFASWWEGSALTDTSQKFKTQRNYGKRTWLHEVAHMLDFRIFDPDGLRPKIWDLLGRQTYPVWHGEEMTGKNAAEAFANVFVAAFAPAVHAPTDGPISPGLFPNTDPAVVPKIRALLLEKYPLIPSEDDVRIETVTVPITKTYNGRGHGTKLTTIPVEKVVSVMINSGYDAATGNTQPLPKVAFNNYGGKALFEVQEAGTGGSVDLKVSVKET